MIFEKQTGISLTVAGCIGALVLVITGVLTKNRLIKPLIRKLFLSSAAPWRWLKRWK